MTARVLKRRFLRLLGGGRANALTSTQLLSEGSQDHAQALSAEDLTRVACSTGLSPFCLWLV